MLLEATWLVPLLISLLLMAVLLQAKLLQFGWSAQHLLGRVREESLCWIQPDDGLYWDVENLFRKGGGSRTKASGGDPQATWERFNDLGLRFGVLGTVETDLRYGPLELSCQCRFRDTSVLPTYQLRTARLIEEQILPELRKMIERGDESPINQSEVYVVDDSDKEHDYLKVYHLHKDCQYVRKKSYQTMTTQEAMDAGFRPCLICLKKEIAKSYESLL